MKRKMINVLEAALGMAAMCDPLSNTVYSTTRAYTPVPKKKNLSKEDELESKGLQEYEVNGIRIIAHNEKEAIKRYKHRIKNK